MHAVDKHDLEAGSTTPQVKSSLTLRRPRNAAMTTPGTANDEKRKDKKEAISEIMDLYIRDEQQQESEEFQIAKGGKKPEPKDKRK